MNPPIFSGDYSRLMWNTVAKATDVEDLRDALYLVCCRIQELEAVVRKLEEAQEHKAPVPSQRAGTAGDDIGA